MDSNLLAVTGFNELLNHPSIYSENAQEIRANTTTQCCATGTCP